MKEPFFILNSGTVNYPEFIIAIKQRNKWLIMLRYGAVVMFLCFIGFIELLKFYSELNPDFSIKPLLIINISIFIYNILFHLYYNLDDAIKEKYKIYGLRFSLVQICFDFVSLMIFIYFTGGVDTPLYSLFIFHVIIGSLFLPGRIITLLISLTLMITSIGAYFEFLGYIPHNYILNIKQITLFKEPAYLIVFFGTFSTLLYVSIYLTNSIARELYTRERDLTSALKKLEEAERTKSQYVMTVVHDLKTPIAAAVTYLNMILSGALGSLNENLKRSLERSKVRLDQAVDAINDILQISKIKVDDESTNIEDLDLLQVLDEIYNEMKVLIQSKNQNFEIINEIKDSCFIKFDARLLKLVLSNLISNAYKYTPQNGIIKAIISKTKDYIVLKIADTGIGIPDELRNKIFLEFYRTPLSKKEGVEGTGLGLSLVKHILDKLNCKIEVISPSSISTSDQYPGSEFIIYFPLKTK